MNTVEHLYSTTNDEGLQALDKSIDVRRHLYLHLERFTSVGRKESERVVMKDEILLSCLNCP